MIWWKELGWDGADRASFLRVLWQAPAFQGEAKSPDWRKMGLLSQAGPLPLEHSPFPSADARSWRPAEIRGFEPRPGTPGRQVFVEITGQSHLEWDRLTLSPLWSRGRAMKSHSGAHVHIRWHGHKHTHRHTYGLQACAQSRPHRYTQAITGTVPEPTVLPLTLQIKKPDPGSLNTRSDD